MFFFLRSGIKILRNFQPNKVKPVSIRIHRTASHLISREKIMPPSFAVRSCLIEYFILIFSIQIRHVNAIFQSNCSDCSILFYTCRAGRKAFAYARRGKMKGAPRRLNIAARPCMTVCLKIRFASYAALQLPRQYLSQPDGGIYHKKTWQKKASRPLRKHAHSRASQRFHCNTARPSDLYIATKLHNVFSQLRKSAGKILRNTTLNLKTFNYPLTTGNAFDHICRQQTYGFA